MDDEIHLGFRRRLDQLQHRLIEDAFLPFMEMLAPRIAKLGIDAGYGAERNIRIKRRHLQLHANKMEIIERDEATKDKAHPLACPVLPYERSGQLGIAHI